MIARIRVLARAISGYVGRDSLAVRTLRPAYDWALYALTAGRGIVQTVNGHERFRIDPRFRTHFPETYEPEVCAYLRRSVRPGAIALNVGANIGMYALCLAEWVGRRGHVYAFEPNPAARRVLQRHVALNGFSDRITPIGAAVSDTEGMVPFFADGVEGTGRLGAPNPDVQTRERTMVPVTTIDAFCAEQRIRPDWIVMDIEGHEVAALRRAGRTIESARGSIGVVVEIHPSLWVEPGSSRVQLQQLLATLRLTPIGLQGQADPTSQYGIVYLEPTG